jgi:hypothetical protein
MVSYISAVKIYYFGKNLSRRYCFPHGVIGSNYGIEARGHLAMNEKPSHVFVVKAFVLNSELSFALNGISLYMVAVLRSHSARSCLTHN